MGDAEACDVAGHTDLFSGSVAGALTQNYSAKKKENGYAKRNYNGNNIQEQVCSIFKFPYFDRQGEDVQPDIFVTEKGRKFVGEVKSVKGDRVVVWVKQFNKYKALANIEGNEKNSLFYFFAKYTDGFKPSINDIYVVGYDRMKYFMETKKKPTTRFGLKKKYCKRIDCMEQEGQIIFNDLEDVDELGTGEEAVEIVNRNRKNIIEKYNRKGPYVRIEIPELAGCCQYSRILSDKDRRRSIVVHYENMITDFIKSADYPAAKMPSRKISHVQQALFENL